jgi:hypothetical protein
MALPPAVPILYRIGKRGREAGRAWAPACLRGTAQ